MACIGGIFDDPVLNISLQGNIVATARVMAVFAEVGTIEGMLVFLTLVVFQDDVGIQFIHIFHDFLSP